MSVPPFRITGTIHLMAGQATIREALTEARGPVHPRDRRDVLVDHLGEGRRSAVIIAVNHRRTQILAQHQEIDPWAGLGGSAAGSASEGQPPTG